MSNNVPEIKDIKTAFYCKKFEINSLLKYNGKRVDSKAKRALWKEIQQENPEIFTLVKKSYNNRLIYIITEDNMPKFLNCLKNKGYTFPIREKRKTDFYYKELRDRTSLRLNGKILSEEKKVELWYNLQQQKPELFTLVKSGTNITHVISEENLPQFREHLQEQGIEMITKADKYWEFTQKMDNAENKEKFLEYHQKRSAVTKVIIGNKNKDCPIWMQYKKQNEGK